MRICYFVPMVQRICLAGLLLITFSIFAQDQSIPLLSITFEGNKSIDSPRLKSEFRLCREGGLYQPGALNYDLANLEKLYHDGGFLRATIGPPAVEFQNVPGKGRSALIRIPISEGPVFTVGEIAVKNVHAFQPQTLLRMCPLATGQPYSRKKISEWLGKIEDGYHTMGYVRFAADIKEDVHEQRGVVDCTLECKEGSAYSVGKIVIEGDDSIDRSDFKRHLLLGEGGPYNPEMISLSVQFLNQMGKYKPISESDIEVKIDDTRSTVDLIFHIASRKKSTTGNGSPLN